MQDEKLTELQSKIGEWSDEINPNQTVESLLKHLIEEAKDLLKDPYNPISYADVLILLLTAARRVNYSVEELLQAVEAKHTINEARIWMPPDEKGIVRHQKLEE